MKVTTEIEIKVPKDMSINEEVQYGDYCKRLTEVVVSENKNTMIIVRDNVFIKVEASELSLDDKFMMYQPKTEAEQILKEMIENAIRRGMKDFYCPKYDPTFNESSSSICYKPGKKPAIRKSYKWWAKVAEEFLPEFKSRLGTKYEYIAFLAVLIKKLIASGWTVEKAWNAVCNDSKELGNYRNSANSKHELENTGCREICEFCDLGNTYKILAEDEEDGGFWLAGGVYYYDSDEFPLAELYCEDYCYFDIDNSVGWLVLESIDL